ncbi:MAG: hypothetical protein ABIE92_13885, partial [bacterium]
MVFDEDPVLQTDFWMQAHGITMIFWGNCDLTDDDGKYQGQFNEWDVYITFPLKNFGPLSLGGELDYLNFPSSSGMGGASTSEISAWLSGSFIGSPNLQIYWDVWQYHGIYANVSFSHSFDLMMGNLSLSTALGWG